MSTHCVVVLDRIEPGEPEPEYCVHGRTACFGPCGEWLWLGHQTFEVVSSGEAMPLCAPCAEAMIPAENRRPVRVVKDHLRADGPH